MQKLKTFIDENSIFLSNYAIFLLLGIWFIFQFDKNDGHIIINSMHGSVGDALFPLLTRFGEATLVVTLFIVTPFISYRTFISFLSAYLLGGIFVLLGKYVIFDDALRPKTIMETVANFHFVEGVKLRAYHSFPSGHTQTGFTVFFFASLLLKNASLKRLCWVMALLVSFSRVYISQHFVQDIIAGSMIAVVCTTLAVLFWQNQDQAWLDKKMRMKKI